MHTAQGLSGGPTSGQAIDIADAGLAAAQKVMTTAQEIKDDAALAGRVLNGQATVDDNVQIINGYGKLVPASDGGQLAQYGRTELGKASSNGLSLTDRTLSTDADSDEVSDQFDKTAQDYHDLPQTVARDMCNSSSACKSSLTALEKAQYYSKVMTVLPGAIVKTWHDVTSGNAQQ